MSLERRFLARECGLQTVLVLELLNTAAALRELLLSREEGMAGGTNVGSDFILSGFRHERIAACASYFTFLVARMDSLFHAIHLSLRAVSPRIKIFPLPVAAHIVYHTKAGESTSFLPAANILSHHFGRLTLSRIPFIFAKKMP